MSEIEGRNYQILNTIATGGTAVLYKAIQSSLDRSVVVKRLHSHLTSDSNFTRRFELEAKAAASLDHENIVRIIDFGSSQDNYFIVMEYIDGLSLKEILEKRGTLGDELSLLIAHEICLGLDHAHQRGIIHRDVKPANIMITSEGQVKITDFGLAKLHQSQTHQTVTNTLLGTPLYMSPEQAIGDGIDGRSDLFSLGTICYEMMTGTQPFMGENYAAVIQNIIKGTIPPPSKLGKDIASEAETVVMKALSREPAKRFRTALEMARTIESLVGQEKILTVRNRLCGLVTDKADTGMNRPRPAKRTNTRRRVFLPFAISLVAVFGAIVLLGLNPDRIESLRSRINSLLASNPLSNTKDLIIAGQEGTSGASTNIIPPDTLSLFAPAQLDTTRGDTVAIVTASNEMEPAGSAGTETSTDSLEQGIPVEKGPEKQPEPSIENKPEPEPAAEAKEKEPETIPGYLEISVEPEAEILIDGNLKLFGNRLSQLELKPGRHEIVCRQEGYKDYREMLTITRGELSRRMILLQKLLGGINFETEKGVQIFIDGSFKGTTPLKQPIMIPMGMHRIELKKAGYKKWINHVYIPKDETMTLRIDLIPM